MLEAVETVAPTIPINLVSSPCALDAYTYHRVVERWIRNVNFIWINTCDYWTISGVQSAKMKRLLARGGRRSYVHVHTCMYSTYSK